MMALDLGFAAMLWLQHAETRNKVVRRIDAKDFERGFAQH